MAKYFGLRGSKLNAALIWAVIMPAYILFGFNNGVGGSLVDLPSWVSVFPRIDTVNTTGSKKTENSRVQGTVIALYTLGALFGALSCIVLGDKLGRKRTIMLGALVHTLGAVIQSSSYSLGQLIVGRLVAGLGFGALTATAPNWQSECSSAEHRGSVVLLESVFISFGLALQGWIGFGISHASGSVAWRFPLALTGLFSIIVVGTMSQMPESPRWLIKKGRLEEAKHVLAALEDLPEDSNKIETDVARIEESLRLTGAARFRDIFKNGEQRLFHRACLAAAGQVFQQMCGINALAFYLPTLYSQYLKLPAKDSQILAASVFSFQTLCSPIGVLTVDRFGRRKLMIFAAVGMGCCLVIMTGTVSDPTNEAAQIVAALMIFLFGLFFPTGFLGLTFLYASEIAPLSVRVPITSISTGTAWAFNFLVAEITPVGFATLNYRYFIIYACINLLLILPCVYFFWPETAGKSLEEVDEIFIQSHSIFDPVRVAKHIPRRRVEPVQQVIEEGKGTRQTTVVESEKGTGAPSE
ncbi:Sugar transporter STL1 [Fonsecaea pedrosoi]|nr:Sugar transporter STL1 [Fonsecaea pedrosoi]